MKPFDLEAAKRGEPIMCRDGTPVKFIAYVPDARTPGDRVVVLYHGLIGMRDICGSVGMSKPHPHDLLMVPVKRTVWVNLYRNNAASQYPTEEEADMHANKSSRVGGRAWPLEIEE